MGAEHSQPRERRSRKSENELGQSDIIFINRTDPDVPDSYKFVEVSDEVIQRLQRERVDEQKILELSEELIKQLEENQQLKKQMREMEEKRQAELFAAATTAATSAATVVAESSQEFRIASEKDISDKQNIFNETANRVEQVFFSKHYPHACAEDELAIMECLNANTKQILRCKHLLEKYQACIEKSKYELVQDQLSRSQNML